MNKHLRAVRVFLISITVLMGLAGPQWVAAADDASIERDSKVALNTLYDGTPGAKALHQKASGILVFPRIVKGGLVVGAQAGDGVLFEKDKVTGHYSTTTLSIGLQAGGQTFGYALFFMSDKVLSDFKASKNFEIGIGPNIVVLDAGAAKNLDFTTAKADVYGLIFSQKGLMAGITLDGSKITKTK